MNDFPSIDLSVLTARQREVIEMHYASCVSFGAIAMLTRSNYHAVAEMHRRAILRLRQDSACIKATYK